MRAAFQGMKVLGIMAPPPLAPLLCQFSAEETTWAAVHVLRAWIERYGVPRAPYTDWKNGVVSGGDQTHAMVVSVSHFPDQGELGSGHGRGL